MRIIYVLWFGASYSRDLTVSTLHPQLQDICPAALQWALIHYNVVLPEVGSELKQTSVRWNIFFYFIILRAGIEAAAVLMK